MIVTNVLVKYLVLIKNMRLVNIIKKLASSWSDNNANFT